MPLPNFESAAVRVGRQLMRAPRLTTRIGRASGGIIPDDPSNPFTGPLVSDVPGRTDNINTHVPSGSYVIPADIVSAVGEGNSLSGLKVLSHMFTASPRNAPAAPYTGSAGPYGSQMPRAAPGSGISIPHPIGLSVPSATASLARGGKSPVGSPAPVAVAGGEFIIHPADVARIGDGNVSKGHKVLDAWVKAERQKLISKLKSLPGPARS